MNTCCDVKRRPGAEPAEQRSAYTPAVDIIENENELILYADVPGAAPDGIQVDYEDGVLTLVAALEPREPAKGASMLREYGVGDFRRTFRVGENIDPARIAAEVRDGVLILRLPKSEKARPRRITVQPAA